MEEAGRLACVDASVCIALESIGRLDLLPGLFSRVLVSEGVLAELINGRRRDDAWLVIRNERTDLVLGREIAIPTLPSELHRGEREVIGLSIQRRAIALLDDSRARRAATARAREAPPRATPPRERTQDRAKRYFMSYADHRSLLDDPGEGRRTLGQEAARKYSRLRSRCPEDVQLLETRIAAILATK